MSQFKYKGIDANTGQVRYITSKDTPTNIDGDVLRASDQHIGTDVGTGSGRSVDIPANTLVNDGDIVEFEAWGVGSSSSPSASKTITMTYGGTTIADLTAPSSLSGWRFYVRGSILKTGTNTQTVFTTVLAENTSSATEWHQISCVPDTNDSLDGTYFVFYEAPLVGFYVWYDTGAGAGDPSPTPPNGHYWSGIRVPINTNETREDVAIATEAAISASSYHGTTGITAITPADNVDMINDVEGATTSAYDAGGGTGFDFFNPTSGGINFRSDVATTNTSKNLAATQTLQGSISNPNGSASFYGMVVRKKAI